MIKRTFLLHGYKVEVWQFGSQYFFYPSFNGNMEIKVSSKGFRRLSHYLRTCTWINKQFYGTN